MKYLPQKLRERFIKKVFPEADAGNVHLDHDHWTGEVRGVLTPLANTLLGKIENHYYKRYGKKDKQELSVLLESLAVYIRKEPFEIWHWNGAVEESKRFKGKSSAYQIARLRELGLNPESNSEKRRKQFLKHLKKYEWSEL